MNHMKIKAFDSFTIKKNSFIIKFECRLYYYDSSTTITT